MISLMYGVCDVDTTTASTPVFSVLGHRTG
jgi:hypothetical protein